MNFFPPELLALIKQLSPYFQKIFTILNVWWWVFLPILFWGPFKKFYLYWRNCVYDAPVKKIVLEIKIPREIRKPIKAMEYVFSGFHAVHDVPNWKEKWIEGVFQYSFSLEIASIEGEIHFFIRCPESFRPVFESNIYAQYPEVEITEVEDYTRKVPKNIPNENWDVVGADMEMAKPNCYPIKTYTDFEREVEIEEERMVDPLAGYLEGLATLGEGEYLWLQILCKPILDKDKPWVTEGKKIRDALVQRKEKPKPKPMIKEALEILITGPSQKEEKKEEVFPAEARLTPGEKDIIEGIERKISKSGYDCCIRFVYLGKKDKIFKPKSRIPYGFFKSVSTFNLNGLKPEKTRMTRSKTVLTWYLDKRIAFWRKKTMFQRYITRKTPLFPRSGGTFVLNTEELATLFHFPSQGVATTPMVPRIDFKKGEPPARLPTD